MFHYGIKMNNPPVSGVNKQEGSIKGPVEWFSM